VIVCSRAVAESARRRLHVPEERISVIPLAVGDEFETAARDTERLATDRERLALPPRYLVFAGRYDARKDLRTLFDALTLLKTRGGAVPPVVIALDIAFPDDHARVSRAVAANALSSVVTIVSTTGARQRAAVISGSEAFVYPALSEATGLPALEALAMGVPVISSKIGALPETVGSAGIVVEPRDPARMAAALDAMWAAGPLARQLRDHAVSRSGSARWTWADVARETRSAYARAVESARTPGAETSPRSGFRRFALR
jgi:glycosyltransferase involved in cell wall biosynthesis